MKKNLLGLGLMLMVCGIAQATIIETATIYCDADAGNYDATAYQSTTFGNGGGWNLVPNKHKKGFLHFDLSSLAGKTITSVQLMVTVNWTQSPVSNGYPVNVYTAAAAWDESTVDWIERMAGVNWTTAGGDLGTLVCSSGALGNSNGVKIIASGDETTNNILVQTVQNWANGGANYGFIIQNETVIASSQRAITDRETNPMATSLVVSYEIPEPATLGLLVSGVLFMMRKKK
ncbi:MAG: hypothetical protein A2Y12_19990 [Planctomycetes bacterium GWF2_42_9]|nr:MAG: hypothetical protein A2Y12_19990 [Planctomycetes bacterium GWF2_42_9]